MNTAVLRVKRKNTGTPLDTLVIASKRAKTESPLCGLESELAIQTVVQFAGTLKDPTEDVTQHVAKVMNTEIVQVGCKRTCDGNYCDSSNKKWIGVDSLERYKVVNCQRSQDTLNEEKSEDKWLTLIDVEDSWSVSNAAKENAEETEDIEDFVFDLYCGPTKNDIWFENNEILVQEPECLYLPSEEENEDFSEDSNSESNVRNDYPDTDNSRDEDYDSDCPDDDDDDYLYTNPREEEEDEKKYGCSWAEYRRMIRAMGNRNSSNDEGRSSNYSSDESMGIM